MLCSTTMRLAVSQRKAVVLRTAAKKATDDTKKTTAAELWIQQSQAAGLGPSFRRTSTVARPSTADLSPSDVKAVAPKVDALAKMLSLQSATKPAPPEPMMQATNFRLPAYERDAAANRTAVAPPSAVAQIAESDEPFFMRAAKHPQRPAAVPALTAVASAVEDTEDIVRERVSMTMAAPLMALLNGRPDAMEAFMRLSPVDRIGAVVAPTAENEALRQMVVRLQAVAAEATPASQARSLEAEVKMLRGRVDTLLALPLKDGGIARAIAARIAKDEF